MSKSAVAFAFVCAAFLMTNVDADAAWYKAKVTNVTPVLQGNVTVRFLPGLSETKFTGEGKAFIDPYAEGAKNMLATILTAISMNKEVSFELATLPSGTNQPMTAVSLVLQ